MPFNNKKTIKISDFLDLLRKRLEAGNNPSVLIFFESFLEKRLVTELIEQTGAQSNLSELEVLPGDFDEIYSFAVQMLHNAASRNFSEAHSDIYEEAHAVSEAFCAELNEVFECSGEDGVFDLIPIKSFTTMAVEAGVVTVEDDVVKLTPQGEEMAQTVKEEIEGH